MSALVVTAYPDTGLGTLPDLDFEISLTPPTQGPVFRSIAGDVRLVDGFTSRRGRSDNLERFNAGTFSLTLDNQDRWFDDQYTSSPFYGHIVPMRRCRLLARYSGTTYVVWDGYVDGWEQGYPGQGADTVANVTATDGFKVLSLKKLLGSSPFTMQMLRYKPTSWWRLGESSTSDAATDVMGANHGAYDAANGTISFVSGLVSGDSDTAFLPFGAAAQSVMAVPNSQLLSAFPFSVVAIGKTPTSAGDRDIIIAYGSDQTGTDHFELFVQATTDLLFGSIQAAGVRRRVSSAASVADSVAHHFAFTGLSGSSVNLYVDGVDVTTAVTSNTPTFPSIATPWGIGNEPIVAFGAFPWGNVSNTGPLDEVAVWNGTALDAAQVLNLSQAVGAWSGVASGTCVTRIADAIGWPSADRDIDTGNSTLGVVSWSENTTALDLLQTMADTENGQFYMGLDGSMSSDHTFKLVWRQRHALLTAPRSATSQATFGDGGGSELQYAEIITESGDTSIYNEVNVQRANGTVQQAVDQASQEAYFSRTLDRTGTLHQTDNDAFDMANWLLGHHKDPKYRVTGLVIKPQRDPTNLWPQVLGREIGDRITVKVRPSGVGSAISKDVIIIGVEHSMAAGEWTTTWRLSEAETQTYWILDDVALSILDSTTRLAA